MFSLTAGEGNALFHYVSVDAMSGIMVCPLTQHTRVATSPSPQSPAMPLHADLVSCFHRACISVREVLCRRCILVRQRRQTAVLLCNLFEENKSWAEL